MNATVKKKILDFYAANKAPIDSLAAFLNVQPLWLVCVWYNESGLDPLAKNSIGAVGLNQMLPSTLAGLNSSPSAYLNGGVAYQCTVMKDYFRPVRGKIKRASDLYLFNFYPEAVIKNYAMDYPIGEDENFTTRHGVSLNKIYDQNKVLDYNKDGKITRQDIVDLFENKYDELVKGEFFFPGPSNRPEK